MKWTPRYKPTTIDDMTAGNYPEYELHPEAERADLYLLRQQFLEEQRAEIDAFRRRMQGLSEEFIQETERAERHYRVERKKIAEANANSPEGAE